MHMHAHQKHATIQIRNMITQHYSTHSQHQQQHMITTSHEHITLITTHGINIQQVYPMNDHKLQRILPKEAITIPQASVTEF